MSDHWLGQWLLGALFIFALGLFGGVPIDVGWMVFSVLFGGVVGMLLNDRHRIRKARDPAGKR